MRWGRLVRLDERSGPPVPIQKHQLGVQSLCIDADKRIGVIPPPLNLFLQKMGPGLLLANLDIERSCQMSANTMAHPM